MRPFTLMNLLTVAAAQVLAVALGCASAWGVWLWLAWGQPFK
jgi:hypothetical protein